MSHLEEVLVAVFEGEAVGFEGETGGTDVGRLQPPHKTLSVHALHTHTHIQHTLTHSTHTAHTQTCWACQASQRVGFWMGWHCHTRHCQCTPYTHTHTAHTHTDTQHTLKPAAKFGRERRWSARGRPNAAATTTQYTLSVHSLHTLAHKHIQHTLTHSTHTAHIQTCGWA